MNDKHPTANGWRKPAGSLADRLEALNDKHPTANGWRKPAGSLADRLEALNDKHPTANGWRKPAGSLADRLEALNDKLRQWREAYALADNAAPAFRRLDAHARDCVGRWLVQAGDRRGERLERFRRSGTAAGWTWEVGGVRLLQLAELPPRKAGRLVRKPAWQRS